MLSPYSRFLIFAAVVVQYAHAVRISYYEAENPLCLQFSASAVAGRGTPVSLAACRINDPSQDFTFKPNGELSVEGTLVTSSGLCLEDANTAVMLKTCNGSPEQTFNLAATQDPTLYQLISFNRNCFTGKPDNSVALEVCLTARTQIFRVSHNNDIPPPRPAPVAIMSFRAQSGNCWEHGGTAGAALRTAPCDNRPVQTFNVIRNIVQGGIFIQTSDSALCVGLKNQDRTANGVFQVEPCTGVNSQLFRNRTALVGGSNIAFANAFAPRFCIGEKSTSVLGISACDATASFVSIARPGPVTDNGDAAAGVPTDAFRIFNNDNLCLSVEPPPSDRRPNFKPCTNNNINQWWYSDFGRIVSKALPNTNAKCLEVIDASNRTGVVPALANCGVNVNQIYLPVPMGGFKYALKFAHTNMCARSTFSTNDGRTYPIQIRCDTTNPTQIFTISKRDGLATRPRPSCANVKARKEWRDMTTAEKQAFFNAVQRLRTTPSRAGRRSFYDDWSLLTLVSVVTFTARLNSFPGTALSSKYTKKPFRELTPPSPSPFGPGLAMVLPHFSPPPTTPKSSLPIPSPSVSKDSMGTTAVSEVALELVGPITIRTAALSEIMKIISRFL
ncbi:hypothetical protein BC829DRAFT_52141 [Chytridium lagenaria]|nr:hypothetical protein BC829DRAFT_52141 [Chytridium lagenaria]